MVDERRKVKDDEGLSSEKAGVLPSVEMGKTEGGQVLEGRLGTHLEMCQF